MHPNREFALDEARHRQGGSWGVATAAIDYWKRAIAINPVQAATTSVWRERTWLCATGWKGSRPPAGDEAGLQPASPQARQYLVVEAAEAEEQVAEAETEFAVLMQLDPPDRRDAAELV